MVKLIKCKPNVVRTLSVLCGLRFPERGDCYVLSVPGEGLISFATVSENNIITHFGTRPDKRMLGYARILMDSLTQMYPELSVAISENPGMEAVLLGSGFHYDGDNVLKYSKGWDVAYA